MKFEIDDKTGMIVVHPIMNLELFKINITPNEELVISNSNNLETILQAVKKTQEKLVNKQIQEIQDSKNTIVIDVKCRCGHWGHLHPLFDSDSKKHCRSCKCDNYEPKFSPEKIEQNQKIVDALIEEWKVWENKIKMLEFELTSKDFEISQDTFNQRASHYLDKKNVLKDIYMRITGKDIKDL